MAALKNMRRSKRPTDLNKISQDLSGLFTRLGLTKQLEGYKLLELWSQTLDDAPNSALLKSKTFAVKLNKNMDLLVGVRSAALANELQFLKPQLMANFNKLAAQQRLPAIKAIIFELR